MAAPIDLPDFDSVSLRRHREEDQGRDCLLALAYDGGSRTDVASAASAAITPADLISG